MAMYSYNGVVLPELPVGLSSDTYPYLAIIYLGDAYRLIPSAKPLSYYSESDYECLANTNDSSIPYAYWSCRLSEYDSIEDAKWKHVSDGNYWANNLSGWCFFDNFIWANYDIYICEKVGNDYIDTNSLFAEGSSYQRENWPTEITIVSPDKVLRGYPIVISARVSGTGAYNDMATVTISGQLSEETTLTRLEPGNNYLLRCASDEAADIIIATATSAEDTTLTATKEIKVVDSDHNGNDNEDDTGGTGGGGSGDNDPDSPGDNTGGTGGGGFIGEDSAFLLGIAVGMKIKGKRVE